uniref:NADH-ubiquinone oxidoreductase chain 4L n=1 Tax=Kaestneriella sp. KaspPE TaxID=2597008 RepID=A0A8K1ZFQ6_9NEOP|nr:NADH dehydrogenase subunit 4L [Kaestneriella sp. KaspPE]
MLMNMYMVVFLMFLIGLYSFFIKSQHLLVMMLSIEFMNLFIFVLVYLLLWSSNEKYVLMYFLTICVCEAALGLSILVGLVRCAGNDYLQSAMFLKC